MFSNFTVKLSLEQNLTTASAFCKQIMEAAFYFLIIVTLCTHLTQSNAEKQILKHPYEESNLLYDDDELHIAKLSFDRKELNNNALMFYLRLVKQIFTRHRFKADPHSEDYYVGSISFKLTKLQYELLVNTEISSTLNLNEIDGLMEEIFKQSAEENEFDSKTKILYEYYKQELIYAITSFSSPFFWIITTIFAIYIASKFLHLSNVTYSAIILFIIFIICGISYAMMYHDCLNDLEVEQMFQLSKENSLNNPCKNYHREHESFWNSMKAIFSESAENECLKHMKKTFKSSKMYCDPLDVFAKWSAKIQMSYFGAIFGEVLDLLSSITSSSNIITKIITWTASILFFAFVFVAIIKKIIKHSFQGFFSMLSTSPSTKNYRKSSLQLLNSKMDALLLENEHMKRELLVIRECSVERSIRDSSPPPTKKAKTTKLESIKEKPSNFEDDNLTVKI